MDVQTSTDHRTDEELIREVVTDTIPALQAHDAERVVARYAPGAIQFDLAPPLQHTDPELRDPEKLRAWMSGFDGPLETEIRDLTVAVSGNLAFCHSLNRLSATPKGSSESFDLWTRSTLGLRKIDGRWRITHEHVSTPFHMDRSFRAATDLIP